MSFITCRNNASILNIGGGFQCQSEYPWCIIKVKIAITYKIWLTIICIQAIKTNNTFFTNRWKLYPRLRNYLRLESVFICNHKYNFKADCCLKNQWQCIDSNKMILILDILIVKTFLILCPHNNNLINNNIT
ncbi:Uncharacterized protein FWK35_00015246 [Aphis craccivora]|uniref:Uncharacterized protein n=1 Tax=Aphis craccivora TaxID=307492 RepID=A0A6G0YEK9_APHCR|nr:Uncharacterized protein FWK35_00015246 [Aphis craccivora]